MKRRPSSRIVKTAPQTLSVSKANVKEWARAYSDGELSKQDARSLQAELANNPAIKKIFDRRCEMLGVMSISMDNLKISEDYDQQASSRMQNRNRVKSDREAQGLETSSQELSSVGLGFGRSDDDYEDELEDEQLQAAPVGFFESLSNSFGVAPWWLISGTFHALLLLLVTLITMVALQQTSEDTVIVTELEKVKEPEKEPEPVKRDIVPQPVEVQDEVESDMPQIITHEEVEIADHVETPDESDAAETQGEDGMSDTFLGGSGTVAALGLGGGGGGAFGRPGGAGGRMRRAARGGGGKKTESAVDAALKWLALNQEADGSWDVVKHGGKAVDPGITALGLLAFLGAGHTEKIGKYKIVVQKAVAWIISKQGADGSIGKGYKEFWHTGYAYHHAMCGLALAEAAGMGRIPATKLAALKALNYSTEVHQQGKGQSEKGAWRYKNNTKKPDASVSGWFVMQLKSAKIAGLPVNPACFEGAMAYYDSIEIKEGKGPYAGGRFPYQKGKGEALNTTGIGLLCNLFLGRNPADIMGGAEYLHKNLPKWDAKLAQGGVKKNTYYPMYYTYYGTLTMFQFGGHYWKDWNESMKAMLLPTQCKGGANDGSWDPLGGHDDQFGGRVYMTAMGALCMEVYYRYLPITR